jgi:hypothetical protein
MAAVDFRCHAFVGHGFEEAGPASAGIELGIRREKRLPAADAGVDPLAFVVQQRAAKSALRALASRDLKLLGRELGAPLYVGFDDAGCL